MNSTDKQTHIFTASTPLNALFCATQAKKITGNKYLYFIDQEQHLAEELARRFSVLEDSIFDNVKCISVRDRRIFKVKKRKKIIHELINSSEVQSINHLWLCNDRRFENQFLIDRVKKNDGIVTYVDDGLYSYIEKKWRKIWLLDVMGLLLRKFVYGNWITHVEVIGTGKHINQTALLMKNNALPSLQVKPCIPLNADDFRYIIKKVYGTVDLTNEGGLLLVLPHSSQITKPFVETMIKFAGENDGKVYVKSHPRDSRLPEKLSQFSTVKGDIPLEAIISVSHFQTIVCGRSSVLLTAKWLGVKNIYSFTDIEGLDFLGIESLT